MYKLSRKMWALWRSVKDREKGPTEGPGETGKDIPNFASDLGQGPLGAG